MKLLLLTTIAAVVLVGCGESQSPEPPTAKAPDISIHEAAMDGDIEAVKQHLAAGTDVDTRDDVNGWAPLHWAALENNKEIAELLIAEGADVNAKGEDGFTPLHLFATWGHKEIIELLIAAGADVNAKDKDGRTPLDMTFGKTADLIRKHGGKNGTEDYSIHLAATRGNIEAVKQHLAAGADVNAMSGADGRTPLNIAATHGHKEIAELLITKGADVNAQNGGGPAPLHLAAGFGRKEIAELLIAKGASVNAKGGIDGGTPLHRATEGYMEIVELLIAKGADVNATDMYRRTPLDMVIGLRRAATIDLLRKHGGKTRRELKAEGK
jgi:ankyrin repeat protein